MQWHSEIIASVFAHQFSAPKHFPDTDQLWWPGRPSPTSTWNLAQTRWTRGRLAWTLLSHHSHHLSVLLHGCSQSVLSHSCREYCSGKVYCVLYVSCVCVLYACFSVKDTVASQVRCCLGPQGCCRLECYWAGQPGRRSTCRAFHHP